MLMLLLILLLATATSVSAQQVNHVSPNNGSCSRQPCLTMDQYTQQAETYLTSNSTFVFLAGNHTPLNTVNLTGISNITFKGEANSTNIICNRVIISCENVTNFTIEGLTFILHSNGIQDSSVLQLYSVRSAVVYNSRFLGSGNLSTSWMRAIYLSLSSLTIINSHFEGCTATEGGAIYALAENSICLTGNTFVANQAENSGGAIFAQGFDTKFNFKSVEGTVKAADNDTMITRSSYKVGNMFNQLFLSNKASKGGSIYLHHSFLEIEETIVLFRNNSANDGGGIYLYGLSVLRADAAQLYFIDNVAFYSGGAIYTLGNYLSLGNYSYFYNNSAGEIGGAIYSFKRGKVTIRGNSHFELNCIRSSNPHDSDGGAIAVELADFILSGEALFIKNEAKNGGAIAFFNSVVSFEGGEIKFVDNVANTGGGISIYNTETKSVVVSGTFADNKALYGGAVFINRVENVTFSSINAIGNSKSAIYARISKVVFNGTTEITNTIGSGIHSVNSIVSFINDTVFENNSALSGGAINALHGTVLVSGKALFKQNMADTDGGALYLMGTDVILMTEVKLVSNSAQNGGAMFFGNLATLTLTVGAVLNSSHNYASQFGGVIFHDDNAILPVQCNFQFHQQHSSLAGLPDCFMRTNVLPRYEQMNSYNDTAARDGNYLYGGLLDRCLFDINTHRGLSKVVSTERLPTLHAETPDNSLNMIASQPYQLCSCDENLNFDCSETLSKHVYRGQKFTVSLVAIAQGDVPVSTFVTAKFSPTARLKLNQSIQKVSSNCTDLNYSVYSTESEETLTLYPDGPCHDTGLARTVVNVMFRHCPDGFKHSNEECICEERLKEYSTNCSIDEDATITRKSDSRIWLSAVYENDTYQGLILNRDCPTYYCKAQVLNISLRDPDNQCDRDRSGILCGACAKGYSLVFGSCRCKVCSNAYLGLLLPLGATGIVLVTFLLASKLTVATGMINSVILYANIVQANRHTFLPDDRRNILTVFIAWLNLDIGIETCFYDGMTAYAQTWLQFAFPVYVWVLIGLIILTSRYSLTVSKLIGSNPVATLATLLLISYAKILKVIIEVYSFAKLEYPENVTRAVWEIDANIPYLQSEHLILTVVTSLVLVFLFLPYTLLLLLGYKLYRFSHKKHMRWLNKLMPFLDSYYAPYKGHTRYWTGFLLLIRCALYIVITLKAATGSLLAITIVFSIIGIYSGCVKPYNMMAVNIIEMIMYCNLVILSAVNLADVEAEVIVYSVSGGIVFVITMGIVLYHILYTAKLKSLWLGLLSYLKNRFRVIKEEKMTEIPTVKEVSTTVVELQEPLLEDSS